MSVLCKSNPFFLLCCKLFHARPGTVVSFTLIKHMFGGKKQRRCCKVQKGKEIRPHEVKWVEEFLPALLVPD